MSAFPIPDEIVPASHPPVMPRLLVCSAVLLGANFLACYVCESTAVNESYHLLRTKWKLITTPQDPIGSLILGDSSGNQGIDPDIIASELPGGAINCCTTAGSLVLTDVYMLQTYIDMHGSPDRVILIHTLDAWPRTRAGHLANILPETPLSIDRLGELTPRLQLSQNESWQLWLNRFVPLYSRNLTMGMFFQRPWRLFVKPKIRATGFCPVVSSNVSRVQRELEQFERLANRKRFKPSKINEKSFEAFIDIVRANKIPLYLIHGPLVQDVSNAIDEYEDEANAWVLKKSSEYQKVTLIFPSGVRYPSEQMDSVDHLTESAAQDFSRKVGKKIAVLEANREEP